MSVVIFIVFAPIFFMLGLIIGLRDSARILETLHRIETSLLAFKARAEADADKLKHL
jgi:hypothetical protein